MVDTGMGRLGPFPDNALDVARAVAQSEWLTLEGIATHFSSSSRPEDGFSKLQISRFLDFKRQLETLGISAPVVIDNTTGEIVQVGGPGFDYNNG